jgi:threonine dehydratase
MALVIDVERIRDAHRHIDGVFLDTPVLSDPGLDAELGCLVLAKDETDNPIGSFKGRGTELFAAIELKSGETVVCASAGNFGQGLARAAVRRGLGCIVYAAETANPLKIEAMRRLGAEVRLSGADFDAAKAAARRDAAAAGLRFVEDGAEAAIAEGAGTIGLELAAAHAFDVILVPLGNGALLGGVGTAIRHAAPNVEIIGVVAEGAPAMKLSLEAGSVIETERAATMADGIAVRVPVPASLGPLRDCCDGVVAVSEAAIFEAMRLVHGHLRRIVEPSGAVGLAAVVADPARFRGRAVATILCGRNIADGLRERLLAA